MSLFVVEPSCCASLGEITSGPDGNVWFTEQEENTIMRITPAGEMKSYRAAAPGQAQAGKYGAYGITGGPDGAVWFTHGAGWIGRITTSGIVSGFPLLTPTGEPQIITVGSDGNLWFTEMAANKIGRIGPTPTPIHRRRC